MIARGGQGLHDGRDGVVGAEVGLQMSRHALAVAVATPEVAALDDLEHR